MTQAYLCDRSSRYKNREGDNDNAIERSTGQGSPNI